MKRNVWGIKYFKPDQPEGEDLTTIAAHISWMKSQNRLDSTKRDARGIKERMTKTYSYRRIDVVGDKNRDNLSLCEIKDKYPLLFHQDQIDDKFQRITGYELIRDNQSSYSDAQCCVGLLKLPAFLREPRGILLVTDRDDATTSATPVIL